MSEDDIPQPSSVPDGPPLDKALGLAMAFGEVDMPVEEDGARRRKSGTDPQLALRDWTPTTRLGRLILSGEVTTMAKALETRLPIREVEVIDALLPGLTDDVIKVNMVQRMTDSGRRVGFHVMAAVGNKDGYVGLALRKGQEVAPTIHKAINAAKLNVIPILRGNGSWESGHGMATSIPFAVTGQSGSVRITLSPAPAGKGLVVGDIGKKVLELAGITDVISFSKGHTRTTINYAQAVFSALKQQRLTKLSEDQIRRLFIVEGGVLQ